MPMTKTDATAIDQLLRVFLGDREAIVTLGDLAGLANRAHRARGEGLTGHDVAERLSSNLAQENERLREDLEAARDIARRLRKQLAETADITIGWSEGAR